MAERNPRIPNERNVTVTDTNTTITRHDPRYVAFHNPKALVWGFYGDAVHGEVVPIGGWTEDATMSERGQDWFAEAIADEFNHRTGRAAVDDQIHYENAPRFEGHGTRLFTEISISKAEIESGLASAAKHALAIADEQSAVEGGFRSFEGSADRMAPHLTRYREAMRRVGVRRAVLRELESMVPDAV